MYKNLIWRLPWICQYDTYTWHTCYRNISTPAFHTCELAVEHPGMFVHMPSFLLNFLLFLNFGARGQWLFFYPSFLLSRMSAMLPRNPALLTLVWDKRYCLLCSPSWSERWLGWPQREPVHSPAHWPRQITLRSSALLFSWGPRWRDRCEGRN